MEIVPLGPGFAAELRGVTLADVAAGDAAYAAARAAFEEAFGTGVSRPGGDRRGPARILTPLRSPRSDQGRFAGHRHPFYHPHHDRRGRQGGAGRSPACLAQQGQSALAHRQLVQAAAGADLRAVVAHHSGARRRDRICLDAPCLRAARSGAAPEAREFLRLAPTTPIRAARSHPVLPVPRSARRCRRNAGVWCGRIRPTAAARSTCLARLCDRRHGAGGRRD